MAANSQLSRLEEQLREYYCRVVWTHKTHEKQADIYTQYDNRLKWCQIIITAVVTSGIVITIFKSAALIAILTGVLSFVHLVLTTYMKNQDFGQIAQLHAMTAVQVWNIREQLLSLINDYQDNRISDEDAHKKRDEFHNQLLCIYEKAPRTSKKAYNEATIALKVAEEMSFTKEEIDLLLPNKLRD